MASTPPTLGTRIRRARERARLSQEELAQAVGASVRAVGDWENDRRKPRNRLGALEDALGVSLDGVPEPEPQSLIPRSLRREIAENDDLTSAEKEAVLAAIETTLRGGEAGSAVPYPGGGERRRTAS
jgi:transcriptional regulator with XRE-family HTH domain